MVATLLLAAAAALLPLLLLLLSAATSAAAPASAPAWRLAPLDTDEMLAENPFERPCLAAELGAALATCRCSTGSDNGTYVNCDHVVFGADGPLLPFRGRIHGFSQRWAGHQALPAQLFTASDVPLKRLDLSHNGVVLITERLLEGVEDTLEDINLSHNLLGDQLNPMLSTSQFQNLKQLKRLDLSANELKAVDDALLKGCEKLQELRLNHNRLTRMPTGCLKEPRHLQRLYLEHNKIGSLGGEALAAQNSLRFVNLSRNVIDGVEASALHGLTLLQKMDLSFNKISRLPELLFRETTSLQDVDLSNNYLTSIPAALKGLATLKKLSLSANMIQNLDSSTLAEMSSLESLDLSRNNIAELPNGTLASLSRLKTLQFGVNTLRKVEEGAFRGLDNLEELLLDDNNMLAVPQAALASLKRLRRLSLAYNRIAVVSGGVFAGSGQLSHLVLSHNVIRELADDAFQPLMALRRLELRGNRLTGVNEAAFRHLSTQLQELDLGRNRIADFDQLEMPQMQYLKLDHNNLTVLRRGQFHKFINLISVNMSYNNIEVIPSGVFRGLNRLRHVDLRANSLATLAVGVFEGLINLRTVYLQDNFIQQLDSRSFRQLPQLRLLQLSRNRIANIRVMAFEAVPQLKKLVMRFNRLEAVPTIMTSATNATLGVEALDLGYNRIGSLGAEDFAYWTRLHQLWLDHNRITMVEDGAFRDHRQLTVVNLSHNKLRSLPDRLMNELPELRAVDLSHNQLESVKPGLWQNSSQLQRINLGYNRLRSLPERLLVGLTRVHLNLEHNRLSGLPPRLVDRTKVHALHSIDLSHNFFDQMPVDALQKQFFFLDYLNLANNRIRSIPSDSNVLVTIKTLDLSFNPLAQESIDDILSEPKKVKDLNLAGTGISRLRVLETPFLRSLNLSLNRIERLDGDVFQRPLLLEVLDVSSNHISSIEPSVWSQVVHLKKLVLSANPLRRIDAGHLDGLTSLEQLDAERLTQCVAVEAAAFAQLPGLRSLRLSGLPRLESLPVRHILQLLTTLEVVDIELTEPALQDQLAPAFRPRLRELHVHGRGGLRSISPATLAGLTSPSLWLGLHDTAITNLPASLLFPVPMSTQLVLDLSGAKLPVLSPQFLAAADNHRHLLELRGLRDNPIVCDCNARPFRRWLRAHIPQRHGAAAASFGGVGVAGGGGVSPTGTASQTLTASNRTPRQSSSSSGDLLVRVSASSGVGLRAAANSSAAAKLKDLVAIQLAANQQRVLGNSNNRSRSPEEAGQGVKEAAPPATKEAVEPVTAVYDPDAVTPMSDVDDWISDAGSLARELSEVRCSAPAAFLGVKLVDIAEENLGCDGLGRGEVVVPANENEHAVSGGGGGGGGVKDTIDVVVAARPSRPYNGHSAAAPTYAPTYAPAGVDHQAEPEIIWREDPPPHQQHSPDPFQQDGNFNEVRRLLEQNGVRSLGTKPNGAGVRTPANGVGGGGVGGGGVGVGGVGGGGSGVGGVGGGKGYGERGLRAGEASPSAAAGLNNMDALIIGIVGGVVAFVAVLIIIICLVRLRTAAPYRGGPMAGGVAMRHQHDKCTCLAPHPGPSLGHHHPHQGHQLVHYLPGYASHALHAPAPMSGLAAAPLQTLSVAPSSLGLNTTGRGSIYSVPLQRKMVPVAGPPPPPPPPHSALGLASRASFYPPTPYYVTFPPESES